MDNEQTGSGVASWSTHYIPTGSTIRYVLDPNDAASIRLIIGDHEQVELGMAPAEAKSITTTLHDAERDVQARAALMPEATES